MAKIEMTGISCGNCNFFGVGGCHLEPVVVAKDATDFCSHHPDLQLRLRIGSELAFVTSMEANLKRIEGGPGIFVPQGPSNVTNLRSGPRG